MCSCRSPFRCPATLAPARSNSWLRKWAAPSRNRAANEAGASVISTQASRVALLVVPTDGHPVSLDARLGAIVVADQLSLALVGTLA